MQKQLDTLSRKLAISSADLHQLFDEFVFGLDKLIGEINEMEPLDGDETEELAEVFHKFLDIYYANN
jgi:hypothetical protein